MARVPDKPTPGEPLVPPQEPAPRPRRKPAAAPTIEAPEPVAADGAPRQRFVVSHLLSLHAAGDERARSFDRFNTLFDKDILPSVDLIADNGAAEGALRRVVTIEADPEEFRRQMAAMPPDTLAEPELLRTPALAFPPALSPTVPGNAGPGTGGTLALTLVGTGGSPAAGATVIVRFDGVLDPSLSTVAGSVSDGAGHVAIPYDPGQWRPGMLVVEPAGRYWTSVSLNPQSGQLVQLQELPQTGPLRWWGMLGGLGAYDPTAGAGIRVGVIDSGVGPHPSLAHAVPVGAFLDGQFLAGVAQGRDVQTHGTHVSGIIGARPGAGALTPAGMAPGAELLGARIFTATGGGNQGDVANAVDLLALQRGVDILNMSFVGAPSAIEHDAIRVAYEHGTVSVCASGNQSGAPVGAPALYPEAIAVSALGLLGSSPAGTMPAANIPSQPDRYGPGGLFLASFSNIGPQTYCTAPGNGIISTIPRNTHDAAPFADMSGTSMAAPMVAGLLATLLSRDEDYRKLDRTAERAARAREILARHCLSVGLQQAYQGFGLVRGA